MDPLAGYRVLGFDLETTGFSPKKHRIVQYALVGCDVDGTSMQIEELVNPQMKIPIETTRVHGIHDADVKNSPIFSEYTAEVSAAMELSLIHN